MRNIARLCAALVVASSLATVGGGAAHADFTARWCATSAAPCVQSLSVAGSDVTGSVSTHLDFDGPPWWTANNGGKNLQFFLQGANAGDAVAAVIDLGTHHPDRVSGLQQMSDVDVWQAAGGDWMLRLTGAAIRYARGCSGAWPPVCPSAADSDDVLFEGDVVSDLPADMVGYYMGTNVTNNDISFQTDASGSPYLETEAWSPHYYADGTTVVHGVMHFRLPYVMMRDDFGIPNPETMTAGSLTGTVNSATASFDIAQDPDGGGIYVDVSGFTFTRRTIKVMAGHITPTKPVILKATRPAPRRAWIKHTLSTPRGAKVTGYVAQCIAGSQVVKGTAAASAQGIGVSGLTASRAYDCRVAATSKVGRGPWSSFAHLRRA